MAEPAAAPPDPPAGGRRAFGVALGAVGLLVLLMFVAQPARREPVRCDADLTPGADTVVMLSAAWCGYCRRARAFLQDEGIAHCEYDVETHATGRALFARQPLKVIPVLLIRGDTLVGFNREEIRQSLAAHGLIDFGE